ncbi:MAG TPA: phytoene desaturase family protein [Chryseolinea sp.]|nr:phytoene desaturase family protein [Chryseolinea sp.]HPH46056.1 phytoene desaturase family protein [Chryseolinea sp.]HPM30114.1 phytoene desaturase family protein [Chryseolinea sp.]
MKNCAVIGSGIAGIASAIRIAAMGLKVDVFEANDYPGGKLREQRADGFRFDMGPSVFTMPHLIDELFTLCGKNPRDYFSYTRLPTSFKYVFEDGTQINAYGNEDLLAKEIALKTKDSEESFRKYLRDISAKYEITKEVFIENSLHILKNYFTERVFKGLLNFHKIGAFESMDQANRRFFKDPNLVQLFNHYAFYVGSNPMVAPATLNMIQHLVIDKGTYIPDRGMYSLVQALVKLAEEIGVTFHYNTKVEEIIVKEGRATGIRIGADRILLYDRIVNNMDVYHAYNRLLPNEKKPKRILSQPKSSSILGFYWSVKGQHRQLGVHNMLFSKDEHAEYKAVFETGTICDDPSVYISVTSKHVKDDAPAGCENWFVIVIAPNDMGQTWDELVAKTKVNVLAKVKRLLGITPEIEHEFVLTPTMIKENYSSAFGAVFGNSSNSKFAAFLRHSNKSKVKGLYFVGGSVHPGAGIPMCLNSAKIMAKMFH